MLDKSTFSIEVLRHFKCIFCKKWWSIGDSPLDKKEFYCPWCGKKQEFTEEKPTDLA